MNEARVITGRHLRATRDGRVVLRVSGSGPATVTLRSARPITPRWLGGSRARVVRFAEHDVDLRPGSVTTVTVHLRSEHLALLHRMQTIRATIRLETRDRRLTRRVDLHAPPREAGRDRRRTRARRACPA